MPFNTTNVLADPGYGTITGNIYDEATGNPLYPATIRIENHDTGELVGEFPNYPDGSFHVVVEEGTYRLGARASGYVTAWYPNNCSWEEATSITVELIKGSDRKVRVRFDEKLKFHGKNETERQELDNAIKATGKWLEMSQLDTTALTRVIEQGLWDKDLIGEVMKYGRIEETSSIYLSKLKDAEK